MESSKNQFRRFTFFWETLSTEKTPSFVKTDEVDGIFTVEVYQKGNQCFCIVDTFPEMKYIDIKKILKSKLTPPLERIYEFEQKEIYSPEEGQLKTSLGKCTRFVWTLLLEEDPQLIEEYKRVHSIGQAWPEITQNMKQVGVKDMEIYLHNTQAFLIMDTQSDFDLEKVAPQWQLLPRENEWQEYVAKFQRTSPESSIQEKWLDMKKINL